MQQTNVNAPRALDPSEREQALQAIAYTIECIQKGHRGSAIAELRKLGARLERETPAPIPARQWRPGQTF